MTKLLVSFIADWSDEFEMKGFRVYESKEALDEVIFKIREHFKTRETYEESFGSNESFIWKSANELINCFRSTEISDEEAAVIEKYRSHLPCYFPHLEGIGEGDY